MDAGVSDARPGVILDVSFLGPQIGGIGRYALELGRGLATHSGVSRLSFWSGQELFPTIEDINRPLPRKSYLRRRWDRWTRWDRLTRRIGERRYDQDLFHGPNYFLPERVSHGVITVHDLSVFRHPETHPPERVADFERRFAFSLGRASHIITDTETIRAEVIQTFGVRPETITAVPLGVDAAFRPHCAEELSNVLERRGLRAGGYGLCVSQTEPRKKLEELLRAWRLLPQALRTAFPLALAGGIGWQNDHIHREIDVGAAEGWLRPLGFVAEEELPGIYAGAALFIYPSIYEGFGLPPLEAMASGVPVVVASRSCLPEVCGDASTYIDPDDIRTFSDAIALSLEDRDWRGEARRRGLARAAEFTWARTVDRTVDVYRRAARAS